jgi:putative zinc finger/helix-turn-helix YgiT family protein
MARPYPWKCRSCGKQSLGPVIVDYSTEMEHDGRLYAFAVPNLNILECASCHERVLPDEAFVRITDRLRAEAGLLTPTEIKEKRKKIEGLTQELLATHLGVAKETISRWETGGQIQQRSHDLLLRLYFDLSDARRYLDRRSSNRKVPIVEYVTQSENRTPKNDALVEVTYASTPGRFVPVG